MAARNPLISVGLTLDATLFRGAEQSQARLILRGYDFTLGRRQLYRRGVAAGASHDVQGHPGCWRERFGVGAGFLFSHRPGLAIRSLYAKGSSCGP
jgi:hypothetical protein